MKDQEEEREVMEEAKNHAIEVMEFYTATPEGYKLRAKNSFITGANWQRDQQKPHKDEEYEVDFISGTCKGEKCTVCGKDAYRKVGEQIPFDDPHKMRHELTAYVCKEHFEMVLMPYKYRQRDQQKPSDWEREHEILSRQKGKEQKPSEGMRFIKASEVKDLLHTILKSQQEIYKNGLRVEVVSVNDLKNGFSEYFGITEDEPDF